MSIVAHTSHLYVPFSEKLDSLLDRLDNRRMMHDFQSDTLEWMCMDRNDAHYCSVATLHVLFIPLSSCTDNHLALLRFLLRVSSRSLRLETMEDKRGTKSALALPLRRALLHQAGPQRHRRHLLGLRRHRSPH
jgi:hypothetical protein